MKNVAIENELDLYSNELLFRYRSMNENCIKAFSDDTLYFSTPAFFNDPFDTLIYANFLEILSNVDYILENNMLAYIDKNKDAMTTEQYGLISTIWSTPSAREQLREEMFAKIRGATEELSERLLYNTRVICLSEKFDSMLMWSHYADYHKGFCLVYRKVAFSEAEVFATDDSRISKKPLVLPVKYVETQMDLTEEVSEYARAYMLPNVMGEHPAKVHLSQEKLRLVMTQKFLDWQYEKEWRIIPRHISLEHASNLHHMVLRPEAVILGNKCCERDKQTIKGIADDKGIPVFRMERNFLEPRFGVVPVRV